MAPSKPPAGHFSLLYFAAASSFTGKSSEHWKAPLKTNLLFDALETSYPGIKERVLTSCAVTVNLEYIDMDDGSVVIKEGDEVAIIPPVSSG